MGKDSNSTEINLENEELKITIPTTDQDIIENFMKIQKQKDTGQASRFRHLVFANQTYWEHFCDSLGYFKSSICASFYFFCHAFFPDIFEQSGSKKIKELNDKIQIKYIKRIGEIKLEMHNNN